jgi:hypothetical protein
MTLTVDLITAEVEAVVVEDSIQSIPIIVGQSFLNRANVTLVLRNNQIPLFEKHLAELPEIDELPPLKIALWAKDTTILTPHTIGFIAVSGSRDYTEEIYIEGVAGQELYREYRIPRCITTTDGAISMHNYTNNTLEIKAGKLVARGHPCLQETDLHQVSILSTRTSKLTPFQLDDIRDQLGPDLGTEQQGEVLLLINEFRDCFAVNTKELGDANVKGMQITLQDDIPVSYHPYRLAYSDRNVVQEIVEDLLNNGIIRDSESPYSSPILLVRKKSGEYRMCVDYRSLNAKTIKDRYPLPRVDDYLERMYDSQNFTTLELASGYHQIKVAEDSISKTAFVTPDGHYEYLRMPFGLVNASAVFQRAINSILGKLRHHLAMAYLDDILIPSTTFSMGLSALREVFGLFRQAGMTFRLSKCRFFFGQLQYLGHELRVRGIRPGQAKTIAIRDYPRPTNVHEVRQFIGLTSYFRKFIRGFATLAKPLTTLTKQNVPFVWGVDEEDPSRP